MILRIAGRGPLGDPFLPRLTCASCVHSLRSWIVLGLAPGRATHIRPVPVRICCIQTVSVGLALGRWITELKAERDQPTWGRP